MISTELTIVWVRTMKRSGECDHDTEKPNNNAQQTKCYAFLSLAVPGTYINGAAAS